MLGKPSLTQADYANMQTVTVNDALGNDVEINFVLYSEENWKEWSSALFDSGITQFKGKWYKRKPYDGYTLFVGMTFENLTNDGDSIGLSIPLPNGDG